MIAEFSAIKRTFAIFPSDRAAVFSVYFSLYLGFKFEGVQLGSFDCLDGIVEIRNGRRLAVVLEKISVVENMPCAALGAEERVALASCCVELGIWCCSL